MARSPSLPCVARRAVAWIVAALFLLTLGACTWTAGGAPSGPDAGEKRPLQPVTLRLTWKYKGEHAPLLVAREKGFFAAEGLDVQIAEGSGVQVTLGQVASSRELAAYGSADAAIQAIDKGMRLKVVAVYNREVPWAVVAMPEIPLRSPRDLEGHTLAAATQGTFTTLLRAVARKAGVDLGRVRLVQVDEAAKAAQFLQRKVDLAAIYTNNQLPVWEKRANVRLNVLRLSDYGFRLPGTALIASDESLRSHPDVLGRLHQGILKGFRFCNEDPTECARVAARVLPEPVDPEVLERQIRETTALMPEDPGLPPAGLSDANWQQALDLLHRAGLISEAGPVSRYYAGSTILGPAGAVVGSLSAGAAR